MRSIPTSVSRILKQKIFGLLSNNNFKKNLHSILTLGTAAWNMKFFTGLVLVLRVDKTMTKTSGRGRFELKWIMDLRPFLS